MQRTTRDRISGVLALVALALLIVGVPILLARLAGWPLPRSLPEAGTIRRAIGQADIPADTVVRALAVVVWLMWLQLVWCLVWEIAVNVPRLGSGRRTRPAPLVASPVSNSVARLVALVIAIGVAVTATPQAAIALPAVASSAPPAVTTAQHASIITPTIAEAEVTSGTRWHVDEDDSLWKIADTALGDGERAGEILELNPWLGSPRRLTAGQVLELPADASIPAAHAQPPAQSTVSSMPVAQVPESGRVTHLAPTDIVIEPGDTLWGLSTERLAAVHDDVTAGETLDLVNTVIAANPDVVEDPNLIYPGEVFAFPAVGSATPPPAPPRPPADASTPPSDDAEPTTDRPPPATPAAPSQTPDKSATENSTGTTTPATASTRLPPAVAASPEITTANNGPPATSAGEQSTPAATWLIGISGATALASGILLMYRGRLAMRATRGAAAYRTSIPDDPTVLAAVTRASHVPLLKWANAALAELMAGLNPGDVHGQPLAIELSDTFGIEMMWTEPNLTAAQPWVVADNGWTWKRPYDPDQPILNADAPAALPAMVTIGNRDQNQLLLNLEAVGTLAVDGDDLAATDFVRSLVVELATGELLSDAFLVASGVELDGLAAVERIRQLGRDDAANSLRVALSSSRTFLDEHDFSSAFESRLGGDAVGREATVVVVDDEYAEPLDSHVTAGLSAALVYTGATRESPGIQLLHGGAVLHPFGIRFDPVGLPLTSLESVSDLLDEASEPYTAPALLEPTDDEVDEDWFECDPAVDAGGTVDDLGDDDEWELPQPSVLVRVLGAPEVVGTGLGRIETSIVAYLACHGGTRRDEQVINAVWNGRAVEPKTLWNRISTIRAALGQELVPPRLPNSPNVVISERVVTDLETVRRLLARSAEVSESKGLELLLHGLDLIEGVPFDAAEYDWSFESQDHAEACETIEAATLRCVEIAMNLGDLHAARRAVTQGLRALPMNEPLYRARMRVESASGNPDGVRQALRELGCTLDTHSSDREGAKPAPETIRAARELSARS